MKPVEPIVTALERRAPPRTSSQAILIFNLATLAVTAVILLANAIYSRFPA